MGSHFRWLSVSLLALAGAAGVIHAEESDARALPLTTGRTLAERQVIYEVNLRQYTPEGTIQAFADHLPRLRELGVDILWLMPVFPIGELNRKGGLGSPYSVRDYRAVNPDFGTVADLRSMVGQAHSLGMRVILDWVANHCAWDNPLVNAHPEWLTKGPDGAPQPPVADWSDVMDLDFSQPALREYMIESMVFWLREADIDGFRCDVAGMVPTDFWQQVRPRLDEVKPVFMLAEWEDPALAGLFDMSYGWNLHRAFNAFAKGEATVDRLDSLLCSEEKTWPTGHQLMRFTTNHDENSWNGTEDERLGPAADAFSVLCWTLPGMPLIYSGQEAGLDHRLSFFEKDSILWREHARGELFKRLNQLKHLSPALWNSRVSAAGYQWLDSGAGNKDVWSFLRLSPLETLLVIVNLGSDERRVSLENPVLTGRWRDFESEDLLKLAGSHEVILAPCSWQVLRSAN